MPIYTYRCTVCKMMEDKLIKRDERPDEIVQDCCFCHSKGVKFERIVTAPSGFRFQGEGFYKKTSNFD
jgi:putative FmdB family regulatory protein